MKKSILFVRPDYHCSFFYRDEFRRLGWKADIYVEWEYPEQLLYSKDEIVRPYKFQGNSLFGRNSRFVKMLNVILKTLWYLLHFWRYKYHVYYGRPPQFYFAEDKLSFLKSDTLLSLSIAKFFGCKLVYIPTGCLDEETKNNFNRFIGGNGKGVCCSCGSYDKCDDTLNILNFKRIRRYFDMKVGLGSLESSQFKATHLKYKVIDLQLWTPGLVIPEELKLPETHNLRILHSFVLHGRNYKGRNIKGSPHILAAIEKLKAEGYNIEYIYFNNIPSKQMRYYQAQVDIVVEQIIYGWWGSTGVETMALGKPVVCFINDRWKSSFLSYFPEYHKLPIVEADTNSIYQVLKKLVTDRKYREERGRASRLFAESFFDVRRNTKNLIALLEQL